MSHIVVIKTEVRDAAAVRAACQRLKLPQPVQGTHRLFGSEAIGLGVTLPDWKYPDFHFLFALQQLKHIGVPLN